VTMMFMPPMGSTMAKSPVGYEDVQPIERTIRNDPRESFYWTLPNKLTPQQCLQMLRAALAGDLFQQFNLCQLMLDTWPRFAKCAHELRMAVAMVKFVVKPVSLPGKEPTPAALAKAEADKAEKSWAEKLEAYQEAKATFKADDFDEAEASVKEVLDQTQQGIIVHGAADPALLIYALGKNEAKAKEISAIKDPVKFAFAIAKLEDQLKVSTRKPATQPEGRISGNSRPSGTIDSTLERLREEASKTGDFSKVVAYKRSKSKS